MRELNGRTYLGGYEEKQIEKAVDAIHERLDIPRFCSLELAPKVEKEIRRYISIEILHAIDCIISGGENPAEVLGWDLIEEIEKEKASAIAVAEAR